MSAQKGKLFLLYISTGVGSPSTFLEIGSARSNSLTLNNEQVEVTTKDSDGWRESLEQAGIQNMSLSVSGVFKDTAAEQHLSSVAFANEFAHYKIVSGNGDTYTGQFAVTSYERGGEHNGEETFSASLESAGIVVFAPGA